MTPTRHISPLTLSRVETVATDPASTPALRQFHTEQLADLRARAARQHAPARHTAFSRYLESLEKQTIETP